MIKVKNLSIAAALFIAFQLITLVLNVIIGYFSLSWLVQTVILIALSIFLVVSYKTHQKNVMKPLIGGTLLVLLFYEATYAAEYIQYSDIYMETIRVNQNIFIVTTLLQILITVALAVININHYLINTTHAGSPKIVATNRLMFVLFFVFILIQSLLYFFGGLTFIEVLAGITSCVADAFLLAIIIIIEGLVDEFRIKREDKVAE